MQKGMEHKSQIPEHLHSFYKRLEYGVQLGRKISRLCSQIASLSEKIRKNSPSFSARVKYLNDNVVEISSIPLDADSLLKRQLEKELNLLLIEAANLIK